MDPSVVFTKVTPITLYCSRDSLSSDEFLFNSANKSDGKNHHLDVTVHHNYLQTTSPFAKTGIYSH